MGLDQEAEVLGHRLPVCRQLHRLNRRVVGAVDADAPQERVPRIGREPLPGQARGRIRAVVDETGPTREGPRRASEVDSPRQLAAERLHLLRLWRRPHALPNRRGIRSEVEESELVVRFPAGHGRSLLRKCGTRQSGVTERGNEKT
jgi:hypothetical protein